MNTHKDETLIRPSITNQGENAMFLQKIKKEHEAQIKIGLLLVNLDLVSHKEVFPKGLKHVPELLPGKEEATESEENPFQPTRSRRFLNQVYERAKLFFYTISPTSKKPTLLKTENLEPRFFESSRDEKYSK